MSNEKIEQNKELVEKLENEYKLCISNGQFEKAMELCETLVFEYDYFGYRFDLPAVYNEAGLYDKTIQFVNSWMLDDKMNDTLSFYPRPMMCLGDAYLKQGSFETAIRNYEALMKTTEYELSEYPNAADVDNKKLIITMARTKIGKVYYLQKNYSEAYKYFKSALDIGKYIDAIYYIAHMCNYGKGITKDVDAAIIGYEQIADYDFDINKAVREDSEVCVINANYELGMIYATESEFQNKEKALFRLNKAKRLGFSITEEKIDSLISNIPERKEMISENYKSMISTVPIKILIAISIVLGIISIFADIPILFFICLGILVLLLIVKKVINSINNG